MSREVKLNQLETALDSLDYPCTHNAAVSAGNDVVLALAGGRTKLSDVIARSSDNVYETQEELTLEILNLLPRLAVGEPYQSEGDA